MSNITTCIGTYNSLPFLKLAVHSIRKNEYFSDSPLIVFADGCTDGTDEWLRDNANQYNITMIIEPRCTDSSNGYGMNRCAYEVNTEFINFIHADMYCAKNFDLHLFNRIKSYDENDRALVSSYRIQPNIFHNGKEPDRPGTVMCSPNEFGVYPNEFNEEKFDKTAKEFAEHYHDLSFPKAEGCSFIIRKRDWDFVGGNDLIFKPNGYDDMDLFLRMRQLDYKYETISSSVVYHFAGRGGNGFFGNGIDKRSTSNADGELKSARAFYEKWNGMPIFDEYGMVCGIS